jgi:hypothetical protein
MSGKLEINFASQDPEDLGYRASGQPREKAGCLTVTYFFNLTVIRRSIRKHPAIQQTMCGLVN